MPIEIALPGPADPSLSSDDSSNSENEDAHLMFQPGMVRPSRNKRGKRRRRWRPHVDRVECPGATGEHVVLEEILQREYFAEQFIGDRGECPEERRDDAIRIATTNINKGFWNKMYSQMCVWFIANQLDFLVVADAGLDAQVERTVWSRFSTGGKTPALLVVGHHRVGVVMDMERWQSRIVKDATRYSPSGRSLSIELRVGVRSRLHIIATYLPDTPQRNVEATRCERAWIANQLDIGRRRGYMSVVAGDFNAYLDEELDRYGVAPRDTYAHRSSEAFREWTDDNDIISSFRHRHATLPRYTYQNGTTKSALDDIYITAPYAHQIRHSGVWLYSLNHGDHVGTPFVTIGLDRTQNTRNRLQNVHPIKVLPVKGATSEELGYFAAYLEEQLETGAQHLVDPPTNEQHSDTEVSEWLEAAITNLYSCMYHAAKHVWGETSQGRRSIDRAVSIKRTNRCHGQIKALRRLQHHSATTVEQLRNAFRRVQWPKWVIFPERIPATSPHAEGARLLNEWRQSEQPPTLPELQEWLDSGWDQWKKLLRVRRCWRQRRREEGQRMQRKVWMSTGQIKKFLRSTISDNQPPVNIQGGLIGEARDFAYVETREAVRESMTELLNSWVPPDQKTTAPQHLSTGLEADEADLPQFIREWMLADIKAGGTHQEVFTDPAHSWSDVQYDLNMQTWVDSQVNTGVAPGFGGIPQELWIAAPDVIRERERLIMNTILQTGIVPEILNHRQMVFLPKSPQATGVWNRDGLPPWRPITVQSSLATRLFTAISGYLERVVPNHPMQHGFQRDRNVQDAALATTLLLDRAKQLREDLYLLSKDCEKCYDRIPRWVMAYIYKRIGVPNKLYDILMGFLSAGDIDVRSAFGWIPTGKREFGLGQGSVLSIRHIGFYMDLLMERQADGVGAVVTNHSQAPGNQVIAATVLVDDVVDVATTREGIESRVRASNIFTGINATGGVFCAAKSFLLHYQPGRPVHEETIYLNDGHGVPRPVAVVSPAEGFKHLGITQSTDDMWSKTLNPVWRQLKKDADAICRCRLSADQLRYIVNSVWIPRLQYRTQLNTSLKMAHHIDKLIRRVARTVLRLPYGTPKEIFHDREQGIGLTSFEDACNASRVQLALRVHNSPHIPAYHLLVEGFELYQVQAGLTAHPLELLIEPPPHLHDWIHQTIRAAARLGCMVSIAWINPKACTSERPNDRSIWPEVCATTQQRLLRFNVKYPAKIRFIGDLADTSGTRMLRGADLARRGRWPPRQCREYAGLEEDIRRHCCTDHGYALRTPVGRTVHSTTHLMMEAINVHPDGFFVVSQFVTQNESLELRGYELGQRVGDRLIDSDLGLGTEIEVQWWHERTPGSDVWTPRPEGRGTEYADVCTSADVTSVSRHPSTRTPQRVIIWTDTCIRGVTGTMDRELVHVAFERSNRRYQEVLHSGAVPTSIDRRCRECRRLRGSVRCVLCGDWHHPNCRLCGQIPRTPVRTAWTELTCSTTSPARYAAGDGSVLDGGTRVACGAWGLRAQSLCQIGRIKAYWADITSTRCECHALIAGLAASGDSGIQVCDNQAAIRILETAREIAQGKRPAHIKYRNPHRVEIRSMAALMRPGGNFTATWVRSHQEQQISTDRVLVEQRNALARADRDAATGHDAVMSDTYSHLMHWDMVHLVDEMHRPVLGSAYAFLLTAAAHQRKQAWQDKQRKRGPHRQTACEAAVVMPDFLQWDEQQCRFYWRSIGYVLHTNAQKNRLCPQWEPHCRLCPVTTPDSQGHRYGLGPLPCTSAASFYAEYSSALEEICCRLWVPDQEYYTPGRGHEMATESGRPTRAWWTQDQSLWRPTILVAGNTWVHAINLLGLVRGWRWAQYASHLYNLESQRCRRRLTGRLLPLSFQRVVRTCSTEAIFYQYHPSQISTLWRQGTLHDGYPIEETALTCTHSEEGKCLWVDYVFVPEMADWWNELLGRSCSRILWIACYDGTAGYEAARAAGGWYASRRKR